MAREDTFGFTHLVEEDDTEDAPDKSYLNLELQPHLNLYNNNENTNGSDFEVSGAKWQQPTFLGLKKSEEQLEKEVCSVEGPGILVLDARTNIKNSIADPDTSCKSNPDSSEHVSSISSSPREQSIVHIQYSATDGKVNVLQGQLGTRSDGSRSIDTQGIPEQWSELERPLRQRRLKCLKIFSIISCIAFFPFGILAVHFAFKTEREFNEGIMKGNIDRAQKFAKRTEKLIVISFIMFLVVVALVIAGLVKSHTSRSVPQGPVMG